MGHTNVLPPTLRFSFGGPGSGIAADPIDEVPCMEYPRVTYPDRIYRPHATANKNWYVDGAGGNDAWDGTSVTAAGGLVGPKRTIAAAIDVIPGSSTTDLDTINVLPGGVQTGGLVGEYHEGEKTGISKSFRLIPYQTVDQRATPIVLDGRGPALVWTRDGVTDRWSAPYVCGHVPALNEGQGDAQGTQSAYHNLDPAWATDLDVALALLPVSWGPDGEWIKPAPSSTLTSLTSATTTATATTSAPHGLATNDSVTITNVTPSAYCGNYRVNVTGLSTFTYTFAGTSGAAGAAVDTGAIAFGMRWVSKYQVTGLKKFYHDNDGGLIWVGQDPTGVTVRAGDLEGLWKFTGGTQVIQGIVVRGHATAYGAASSWNSIIATGGSTTIFENCYVGFTPAGGFGNSGTSQRVYRDNSFSWCLTGSSAVSSTTNLLYERNVGKFFNWMGGATGWHCGLFKSAKVGNVVYSQNSVQYSKGPGLWLDYANLGNNKIINNRVDYCVNFGISNEKTMATAGSETIVAGNVITNCLWGIGITGGAYVWIYLNTIALCGASLRIYDDIRTIDGNYHTLANLNARSNLLVGVTGSTLHGQFLKANLAMLDSPTFPATPTDGVASEAWFPAGGLNDNVFHAGAGVAYNNLDVQHDTVVSSTDYAHDAWSTAKSLNVSGFSVPAANPGANPILNLAAADFRPTPLAGAGLFLANGTTPAPPLVDAGAVVPAAVITALGPAYGLPALNPGIGARVWPGARRTGVSFRHRFTGADHATVSGFAETKQPATVYAAAAFGISSNKGYFSSDADLDLVTWPCMVQAGHLYATIEGTLNSATVFRSPCLTFRHIAGAFATDYLYIGLVNGVLSLRKADAGVHSTLSSASGLTTTNGVQYRIHVVCAADTALLVYLADVLRITANLTGANGKYRGGSGVGCLLNKGSTGGASPARIDDMLMIRL